MDKNYDSRLRENVLRYLLCNIFSLRALCMSDTTFFYTEALHTIFKVPLLIPQICSLYVFLNFQRTISLLRT